MYWGTSDLGCCVHLCANATVKQSWYVTIMLMYNSSTTHPSYPLQVVGGDSDEGISGAYDLMNSSYYDLLWCADPCYNYRYPNMVRVFSPNTIVLVIHYPTMTEMHFELRQIRVLVSDE